ncbi:MAG TPA: hypothetical protein VGN72_15875 [Tepidisphaeraceae bacterium]|nr:hypothetical protein [Tepidisphaeraceae bacterium]
MKPTHRPRHRRPHAARQLPGRLLVLASLVLPSAAMLSLAGCGPLAVLANAMPKPPIKPKYTGLQDQSVAIMVWTDRGVRIDWPGISLDVATGVHNRLATPKDAKGKPQKVAKELTGAKFPYIPASVVRFQREHPETEGMPITEVAPRLGVSRLIYVEIESFQTRSDSAVELYRGSMVGTLRVVEVAPDGTAKVAYEENDVRVDFPRKAQREGVPDLGDGKTYSGTVSTFAQEIVNRFIEHAAPED